MIPSPSTRLVFRSWTESDTAHAKSLWCDPEVTQFFGGPMTCQEAHQRLTIERERQTSLGIQYWPIFARQSGDFIGCAGLRPWQMDPDSMEAGVHIRRSAWGSRFGEEALRAVLAYAFQKLNLELVVAGHGLGHDNSQKLLERIGFRYTHTIAWGPKKIEVRMYEIRAYNKSFVVIP